MAAIFTSLRELLSIQRVIGSGGLLFLQLSRKHDFQVFSNRCQANDSARPSGALAFALDLERASG